MKILLLLLFALPLAADDTALERIRGHWFNGAEINKYDLVQSRYGEEHAGHAEFIFVTEPFLIDAQVKHESGPGDSTDVLKLNALRTFNTGFYSYRTMTSTFQPVDLEKFPHALKTTTSIQDWCGQAFQQLNRRESGWSLQLNSYFQNAGDKSENLPDAPLEDAIWITLRLDPTQLPTGKLRMIPGALFNRFQHIPVAPAAAEAALTENGDHLTYTVRYPELGRTLAITADRDFPHIIREWTESLAGEEAVTRAKLTHRLENNTYWSEHDRADASKRRELGLSPTPR